MEEGTGRGRKSVRAGRRGRGKEGKVLRYISALIESRCVSAFWAAFSSGSFLSSSLEPDLPMICCFSHIYSPVAGYMTSWLSLARCRWRRGAEGRGEEGEEEEGQKEEGEEEEGEEEEGRVEEGKEEEGKEEEGETCRLTTTSPLSAEMGSTCSSPWPLSTSPRPMTTHLALAPSCAFQAMGVTQLLGQVARLLVHKLHQLLPQLNLLLLTHPSLLPLLDMVCPLLFEGLLLPPPRLHPPRVVLLPNFF